jgi:Putative peptidoglycan binding domain
MRRSILTGVGVALVIALIGAATVAASATTARSGTTHVGHVSRVSWPVVHEGARGERVRVIQHLLRAHGIGVPVNGRYGKSTRAAVRAFQREVRVPATGRVGSATWPKLVVRIKRGSRGTAVRGLQHQIRHGYGDKRIHVNGVFGARMKRAVKYFQGKHRGLRVTGVVTVATWRQLEGRSIGVSAPSAEIWLQLKVTDPAGTRVTLDPTTNGNCASSIETLEYTTTSSPWTAPEHHLFDYETFGTCSFEKSSQQWSVTAHYPNGTFRHRLVNVQQVNWGSRKAETVCAWPYNGLPCQGGVGDEYFVHGNIYHWPMPPLTVGGP